MKLKGRDYRSRIGVGCISSGEVVNLVPVVH